MFLLPPCLNPRHFRRLTRVPKTPQYNLRNIQSARLFGDEVIAEAPAVLEETSLDIVVDGLLISDEPKQSMVFLTLDGEQRAYRQGEWINDDEDIVFESINEQQVVIRYLGQLQQVPYESREIAIKGIQVNQTHEREKNTVDAGGKLDAIRTSLQNNPVMLASYVSGSPFMRDDEIVGIQGASGC